MTCKCESGNAVMLDPRWPRREHAVEVAIIQGRLTHAAETTYAQRCSTTLEQILQDHGIVPHQLPETD